MDGGTERRRHMSGQRMRKDEGREKEEGRERNREGKREQKRERVKPYKN